MSKPSLKCSAEVSSISKVGMLGRREPFACKSHHFSGAVYPQHAARRDAPRQFRINWFLLVPTASLCATWAHAEQILSANLM